MSEELASGAWKADPAAIPPDFRTVWVEGAHLKRIGPGQVEVHLQRPTDECHFEGQVSLSEKPLVGLTTAVENTSDCVKTIWVTLADGHPVDASFFFSFRRKG